MPILKFQTDNAKSRAGISVRFFFARLNEFRSTSFRGRYLRAKLRHKKTRQRIDSKASLIKIKQRQKAFNAACNNMRIALIALFGDFYICLERFYFDFNTVCHIGSGGLVEALVEKLRIEEIF